MNKGHFLIVLEQLPSQGWKVWEDTSPIPSSSIRLIPPTSWWRRVGQKLLLLPEEETFCLITAVHSHLNPFLPRTHSHRQAAIDLGLHRHLVEEIRKAADGSWGHNPTLRASLFQAVEPSPR